MRNDTTQRFLWLTVRAAELNRLIIAIGYPQKPNPRKVQLEREENTVYEELEKIWPDVDVERLKNSLMR